MLQREIVGRFVGAADVCIIVARAVFLKKNSNERTISRSTSCSRVSFISSILLLSVMNSDQSPKLAARGGSDRALFVISSSSMKHKFTSTNEGALRNGLVSTKEACNR